MSGGLNPWRNHPPPTPPEHPRGHYVRQAIIIGLALTTAIVVICLTSERESWNLWLTGAWFLVVLSIRRTALRVASNRSRIVGGASLAAAADESGISGVLLAFVLVVVVVSTPFLAPFLLVWNVIQAVRARDALPGEDDGWVR